MLLETVLVLNLKLIDNFANSLISYHFISKVKKKRATIPLSVILKHKIHKITKRKMRYIKLTEIKFPFFKPKASSHQISPVISIY